MKIRISILIILIFSCCSITFAKDKSPNYNGKKISQIISESRNSHSFDRVSLFDYKKNLDGGDDAYNFLSNAAFINLSKENARQLLARKSENILFEIPVSENNSITLELTRSYPLSDDFILTEKNRNSDRNINYEEGLHYWGIVKGNESSIASVSIFRNFVMGIISDKNGNYVLGSLKDGNKEYTGNYIYYNDADVRVPSEMRCDVDKYEGRLLKPLGDIDESRSGSGDEIMTRLPVRVYFEADYKLYQDGNNNPQNVADFISGFFNSVKTIYQNENIPFEVSQIGVWTSADPYMNLTDSYLILTAFGGNSRDNFNGNIGHLLSSRNEGLGGIAWIRVLCSQFNSGDSSGRFAFSNVETNFNNYPAYSWTVNVVAHEMGHSMGSRHTHSCVWPAGPGGSIRAIDSCYYAEGGCFTTPRARIGTIMSYCHLWTAQQGGGINLASGFGPLPGDTIRLRYNQAPCLDRYLNSSDAPVVYDLVQNFPNPFNPETRIRFEIPEASNVSLIVYDMSGKAVAEILKEKFYDRGFYEIRFNSTLYNLSSGIYFYELHANQFRSTKRMVLLK